MVMQSHGQNYTTEFSGSIFQEIRKIYFQTLEIPATLPGDIGHIGRETKYGCAAMGVILKKCWRWKISADHNLVPTNGAHAVIICFLVQVTQNLKSIRS
ncbi:MAG: hypothetical protein COB53_03620 [Elusimicrobia bacterium]|nr:MAG: hypothetical protein COB53_03620 [Elusimicrobiota bacterium]